MNVLYFVFEFFFGCIRVMLFDYGEGFVGVFLYEEFFGELSVLYIDVGFLEVEVVLDRVDGGFDVFWLGYGFDGFEVGVEEFVEFGVEVMFDGGGFC